MSTPPNRPLLEVEGMCAQRNTGFALQISRLGLQQGEILALLGPNGAGKSTLLLCLAGLLVPEQGEIRFEGKPMTRASLAAYRRQVTLVFQDPLLLDTTVEKNISLGLKFRKTCRFTPQFSEMNQARLGEENATGIQNRSRLMSLIKAMKSAIPNRTLGEDEIQRKVTECAKKFGILPLLARRARELSGGEAQRTALARALVLEPKLLLLDEPFSALDGPTRQELLKDLRSVLREAGCTVVVATHDLSEALHLADTLAVMEKGRLAQLGPILEVVNHPATESVAAFVGMETVIRGQVLESSGGEFLLEVGAHKILGIGEATAGASATIGVRPEQVSVSLQPGLQSGLYNSLPAKVNAITSHGPFFRLELDCGFFLCAYVPMTARENLKLSEGIAVFASFKASAVHLL